MILFTLGLIWFDYYLEERIRRDLMRTLTLQRTLSTIERDVELKSERQKLIKKNNL